MKKMHPPIFFLFFVRSRSFAITLFSVFHAFKTAHGLKNNLKWKKIHELIFFRDFFRRKCRNVVVVVVVVGDVPPEKLRVYVCELLVVLYY